MCFYIYFSVEWNMNTYLHMWWADSLVIRQFVMIQVRIVGYNMSLALVSKPDQLLNRKCAKTDDISIILTKSINMKHVICYCDKQTCSSSTLPSCSSCNFWRFRRHISQIPHSFTSLTFQFVNICTSFLIKEMQIYVFVT